MNPAAFTLIPLGFGLVTIIFFALLLYEIKKGMTKSSMEKTRQQRILRWTIIGLILWVMFVSAWSLSGKMGDFSMFPFNMVPVLVIPLISVFIITFSRTFKEIIIHIPQQNLIRLQSFRIFVEVLLWALFVENLAPVQMTFEGRNFDILSGLSGLLVAYLIAKGYFSGIGILIWNLICLGLLINIVGVAILSMPTPFRIYMNDPANTIVTQFPVSLLPGLLVPLAYMLHFFSLRLLAIKQ